MVADAYTELMTALTYLGMFLGFALLVFLAIRHIVCWYWKINDLVKLQSRQVALLESLERRMASIEWRYTGRADAPMAPHKVVSPAPPEAPQDALASV